MPTMRCTDPEFTPGCVTSVQLTGLQKLLNTNAIKNHIRDMYHDFKQRKRRIDDWISEIRVLIDEYPFSHLNKCSHLYPNVLYMAVVAIRDLKGWHLDSCRGARWRDSDFDGLYDVIEQLLDRGMDPNHYCTNNLCKTPAQLAANDAELMCIMMRYDGVCYVDGWSRDMVPVGSSLIASARSSRTQYIEAYQRHSAYISRWQVKTHWLLRNRFLRRVVRTMFTLRCCTQSNLVWLLAKELMYELLQYLTWFEERPKFGRFLSAKNNINEGAGFY